MSKPFVFVLMPFDPAFSDTYKLGIKAAVEYVGMYCERVDEQQFEERILDRIYNQINKADFIISEMTNKNPNVFYETGYAHALNKRVIHLNKESESIPFDLSHHPHIIYENVSNLKDELIKKLNWMNQNVKSGDQDISANANSLLYYIGGQKIESNAAIKADYGYSDFFNGVVTLQIDVHNNSEKYFSEHFELGLQSDSPIFGIGLSEVPSISLGNDNRVLHKAGLLPKIFPDSWHSIVFKFAVSTKQELQGKGFQFVLKIFTGFKVVSIPFTVYFNAIIISRSESRKY